MLRSAVPALVLAALGSAGLAHSAVAAQKQASYVVIVHPDNAVNSVSKKELSRLLLKEISKWDSGVLVQPVDLDVRSRVREAFSRDVHGRSVSSIKNYWQRQIFSGDGVPPPEVGGDAGVIAWVKSRPGGIGYVSASARLEGVKVLRVSSE